METNSFENRPSNNLGAKFLDSQQMEQNFPDYHAFLYRIEEQREVASCMKENIQRGKYWQYYQAMYDNVYAILGGRGTGKSSVLQSMREKMVRTTDDIIFPVIMPETISDPHCSILGWVLATAEQIVKDIEENLQVLERNRGSRWIYDHMSSDSMGFFKDCHLLQNNKLRERYDTLKRDCIQESITASEFSYDDMIGLKVYRSQKQYELVANLNEFWSQVISIWQQIKIMQAKDSGKQIDKGSHPLIIIMFDDIDLVPERALELLNSTFQYFANPNIVIILTASEKVLEQVIWTKMLERMVGSNYQSLFIDFYSKESIKKGRKEMLSLESIDKMTQEYYDKVIPPADRYHLRKYYTISERITYRYSCIIQNFIPPEKDISTPLDMFLINTLRKLAEPDNKTFFICNAKGELHKAYLLIFGHKSRNIANACLAILNFVERILSLRKAGSSKHQLYDALLQLLIILISSNNLTKELRYQGIKLLNFDNEYEVKINYDEYWRLYSEKEEGLESENKRSAEYFDDWNEIERSSNPIGHHHKQLQSLNIQMAALMVMLVFVDNLRELANLSKTTQGQEQKTEKKEITKFSKALDWQEVKAANIFSTMINSSLQRKLKLKNTAWSWLAPFPKQVSINKFLMQFPFVPEHVDHYIGFNPFDFNKVQEYLFDIFYETINTNTDVNSKDEDIINTLIGFLVPNQNVEEPWVKTVFAMLSIHCSSMSKINPTILNFCMEDRKMLEDFSFGGQLKDRIQQCLKHFVYKDLTLEDDIEKLYNNITREKKRNHDTKKFNELCEKFGNASIDILFSEMNKSDNSAFFACSKERESFILWCAAQYIGNMPDHFIIENFANKVIKAVESAIKTVSLFIRQEGVIYITLDNCASLLNELDAIPLFSTAILDARSVCKAELEAAENLLTVPHEEADLLDEVPVNEPAKVRTEKIALASLLRYLKILRSAINQYQQSPDDDDNYIQGELIKGYFRLVSMLNPVIPFRQEIQIKKDPVDNDSSNQSPPFANDLLPSAWVALSLNVIEYLIPYYFSAKIYLATGIGNEDLHDDVVSGLYPNGQYVNQILKKLYNEILKPSNENTQGLVSEYSLKELLLEAKEQASQMFIEYLESNDNE